MDTILHILNTGGYSGAENVAISLIREMTNEYPNKYRFIYVSPKGIIDSILEDNNIEREAVLKINVPEVSRVIKEYRPSIIHAHDYTASIVSAIAANKTPVISHIHNNNPWSRYINVRTVLYAITCSKFKRILGVSKSVFDEFIFGDLFRNKELVIGNPISIEKIREKAEHGQSVEENDVIFLGRLTAQKNPMEFLAIMKAVCAQNNKCKAVMVGDGELRQDVEKRVIELGLEDNVTLAGFQTDPYVFLKNAKVLCLPSLWEGYGLSAVEALALGVPVVASPVGGLVGIVTDKCGKLCTDLDDFKGEICRLINDKAYYENKAKNAYNRANEMDNMKDYISRMNQIYTEVVDKK